MDLVLQRWRVAQRNRPIQRPRLAGFSSAIVSSEGHLIGHAVIHVRDVASPELISLWGSTMGNQSTKSHRKADFVHTTDVSSQASSLNRHRRNPRHVFRSRRRSSHRAVSRRASSFDDGRFRIPTASFQLVQGGVSCSTGRPVTCVDRESSQRPLAFARLPRQTCFQPFGSRRKRRSGLVIPSSETVLDMIMPRSLVSVIRVSMSLSLIHISEPTRPY